ncbi:type II toxin-antitoxin system VapC family toxin [Phytoactinopolyspora halotolerans]|uniref:Type II toxin-antitoxin system VapC family toxin n=1 Tax=Phytoactinopolyspora halotolerans TaxID=1981512 RepID=A0A6L9SCE2_9ACTN|nr:type II toxin-antitoxin system VapC family toxin [Phytoactinopolyspora halotolerans]NEE02231.1 type II toxin-antitoxin system VapC family toxin [Phytoactinopolyspora halotolerans]
MSALVVDNSVIVYALIEARSNDVLRQRLSAPRVLYAPHFIDFEFVNALRGLVLGGKLTTDRANDARTDFADLSIQRYPGAVIAERAWELRHNFTVYDAAYIALAELLDCPLLTGDSKLIGSHRANVELYPSS